MYGPPAGGRARTLTTTFAAELAIEDRITLRWDVDGHEFGFYDFRCRRPLPAADAVRTVATGDAVTVTERYYDYRYRQVLRARVRATGRDRVMAQASEGEEQAMRRRWPGWTGTGSGCSGSRSADRTRGSAASR